MSPRRLEDLTWAPRLCIPAPYRFVGRGRVPRAHPGMCEGRTVRLLTGIC